MLKTIHPVTSAPRGSIAEEIYRIEIKRAAGSLAFLWEIYRREDEADGRLVQTFSEQAIGR